MINLKEFMVKKLLQMFHLKNQNMLTYFDADKVGKMVIEKFRVRRV